MTERDPDAAIRCDICNKSSGYNDSREPWEHGRYYPKPTWRCDICVKAVKDAEIQRYM